jgi:transcriptional regulator with XRE-family HTH domain
MVIKVGVEPDAAKRIRARQGAVIRKVRELRGLTIEELAEKVSVTPGAVSQWECGRFTPRQHLQVKLASVLDVPWSTLFGLDGEAVA